MIKKPQAKFSNEEETDRRSVESKPTKVSQKDMFTALMSFNLDTDIQKTSSMLDKLAVQRATISSLCQP